MTYPLPSPHLRPAAWAAALFVALPAVAEEPTDSPLPIVTVTGTRDDPTDRTRRSAAGSRLELSLRETPAAVEVIGRDTLDRRGASTFEEALRGAVGTSAGGTPSSPSLTSTRGFTGGFNTYLFDGSRIATPTMSSRPQDTWNFERIEVLKGPASVLYGEGAVGGTINFVAKRPNRDEPVHEGLVSAGSRDTYRLGAGTGGAVGDTGAYRIDFSHNQNRGFTDRTHQRLDNLTTGVSFDLTPAVKLDLTLDYLEDDGLPYQGTPLVAAANAAEPTDVVSTADGRVVDRRTIRTNYNVADAFARADSLWSRAKLTWQLDPRWRVRNELSYYTADRHWRNAERAVFNPGTGQVDRDLVDLTHDHQVWNNRFDVAFDGPVAGHRNRFAAGVEVGRTTFATNRRFSNGLVSPVSLIGPDVGVFDPTRDFSGAGNRTDMGTNVATQALFAEDAVSAGHGLTWVAGLRFDRVDLDRATRDLNTGVASAFGQTYESPSARLGLVFDATPDTALYAQYTNATAPVGSGNLLLLSQANTAFDLTRGTQWEAGLKQRVPSWGIDWTLAVYRIVLDNVLSRDANNPTQTVNNGSQSSRGVELAATWRPTRQLTWSGNLAALRARFDTLVEAGGASRVGNTPPNVPERVANLWVDYRFAEVPVAVGLGVNRTGAMAANSANTVRLKGHTTADTYARYTVAKVVATLRVRNLTDALYATWTGPSANDQVMLAAPRSVELSLSSAF